MDTIGKYFVHSIVLAVCAFSVFAKAQGSPIENAVASTVSISVYDENDEHIASGSGFMMADGRIATNYHVIDGGDRVEVTSSSGKLLLVSDYMEAYSKRYDLAVLPKAKAPPAKLSLATSRLGVGSRIYVVGAPLGLQNTVSDGIVSAYRAEDGVSYIQITAPISPGSSGGPVINQAGAVIGISVLTIRGGQNLNFAVPVEMLTSLIGQKPNKAYISARRRVMSIPGEIIAVKENRPELVVTEKKNSSKTAEAGENEVGSFPLRQTGGDLGSALRATVRFMNTEGDVKPDVDAQLVLIENTENMFLVENDLVSITGSKFVVVRAYGKENYPIAYSGYANESGKIEAYRIPPGRYSLVVISSHLSGKSSLESRGKVFFRKVEVLSSEGIEAKIRFE